MGDLIIHWNDFFMVIAVITGILGFIFLCRYGIMYDDSDYDRKGARTLLKVVGTIFVIAAAFAVGIK